MIEETSNTVYRSMFGEEVELEVQPNQMGGTNLVIVTNREYLGDDVVDYVREMLAERGLRPLTEAQMKWRNRG